MQITLINRKLFIQQTQLLSKQVERLKQKIIQLIFLRDRESIKLKIKNYDQVNLANQNNLLLNLLVPRALEKRIHNKTQQHKSRITPHSQNQSQASI